MKIATSLGYSIERNTKQMSNFDEEISLRVASFKDQPKLLKAASDFLEESARAKYSYNFRWLGRPIIQYPQDIIAMQELIWNVKPSIIIETGIAHGGSLILYSSLLELNALAGGPIDACVIGVDIDIRLHNREAIMKHPMAKRIHMIEGSSTDKSIIDKIREQISQNDVVLVCLDSNHTHEHVLAELEFYADLVSVGSYLVVFDTLIESMPASLYADRPWGLGNNPQTAVTSFLKSRHDFVVDKSIDNRLLVTVSEGGFLKRIN